MRAGLAFVLASLLIGGAFREWQFTHESRFSDLVSVLEEEDDDRALRAASAPPAADPAADSANARPRTRALAEPLRPAALEVDRATAADFERLPGIGPALAARIVEDRQRRGGFGAPERLDRVPGIGPKILERILPFFAAGAPVDSGSPNAK